MNNTAAIHSGETEPKSVTSLDSQFVEFVDRFGADLEVLESFLAAQARSTEEDLAERLFEFFDPWLNVRMAQLCTLADRLGPAALPTHGAYFRHRLRRFTDQSQFL